MDDISQVSITECKESLYLRPVRMHFKQAGKMRDWDIMKVYDSVYIVIFNVSRDVLIFVRQFRPAVYFTCLKHDECDKEVDTKKYPGSLGMVLELCAGIVDKDQSLHETARDEVFEECGYEVPLASLQKVTSYRSGVGHVSSVETLFYTEVTDSMKTSKGGGNFEEGECIEIVEMTLSDARRMVLDETIVRPESLLFGLMWFFEHKAALKEKA